MEIVCEGCGKKYQIDPKKIKGAASTFQCTECNQKITVLNPRQKPGKKKEASEPSAPASRKRWIGLRSKMLFLYFIIPICLIIAASIYYLNHMETLSGLISRESSDVVTKMAEQAVAEKARAVAREVGIYLKDHPNLHKEDFQNDPEFMKIAIQSVGNTGYTILVSRATENEPSMMWAHPNKELIGVDILKASNEALGVELERWRKVTAKDFEFGKYYLGVDNRERYEFSVPIEGTIFNAVSTTYLDEFTLPMEELQNKATALTKRTTRDVMIILVATALLVALLVIIYSYRLSGRLRYLSESADRISVGDLDVEIKGIKSRDEIGELTHALGRMQTSIRLAIRRLRERR
jgi:nitrogen fixation/metabolism regulation signal transduction histidine kinase